MKTRTLAMISVWGKSKDIPRKNIRVLCGKPLITYTLEAALNSKCIRRIVISTEDKEIFDNYAHEDLLMVGA